jgi:ADP-heptose:LPS heptosyltransferase
LVTAHPDRGLRKEALLSYKQLLKRPAIGLYLALSRRWPRRCQPPPQREQVRKILLFQFGGIGDSLRLFPLIAMLARAFPHAELTTLTNQPAALFDLMPPGYPVCRHIRFDFSQGYPGKWRQIRALRRHRFDLLLLPIVGDGFVEIACIARLIGGRWRAGFDLDGGGSLFTHCIAFDAHESLLRQYARLLEAVGANEGPRDIAVRRDPVAAGAVRERLAAMGMENVAFAVLSPWVGHQRGFKDWPAERFGELAQRLIAELALSVILVGAPSERTLAKEHFGHMAGPRLRDLTGELTISETAELIARSRCLIGNDSSLILVADALHIPTIAVFGATDPVQILAPTSTARLVRTERTLACQPCFVHRAVFDYRCPRAFECLTSIPVARVLREVEEALAVTASV